jgi:1-phosphofructokinase family hexose kinase
VIAVGCFNPAIDKCIDIERLVPGSVARARRLEIVPGGKGVNVALAIAALDEPAALVGIMDRGQRPQFEAYVAAGGGAGVAQHWVEVAQPVRTTLNVREASGAITELLEPGPTLAPAEAEALLRDFLEVAGRARVAVCSGSLPPGLPPSTYGELGRALAARGVPLIIDASGEALAQALAGRPFAVKPNRREAEVLTGRPIAGVEDAAAAARALGDRGIDLVVISLEAEGVVAAWSGQLLHVAAPPRRAVNTVGAGDCLVAGLAVGLARGLPREAALRLAVACGTAKVLNPRTGQCHRADVDAVLSEVTATPLARAPGVVA